MNDNKGQTIFLSVIGIATLLVAIVGATFAWFSATVNRPDEASNSVIIKTATLGTVQFLNGTEINDDNIYPGWKNSKTVSITQTDQNADAEIPYYIDLNIVTNEFEAAGTTTGYIQYYFSVDSSTGGEATAISEANAVNITETSGSKRLLTGTLPGTANATHTYTIWFTFPERGSDQNSQQGKNFQGYLSANVQSSTGYTWDNTNHTYSEYH